MAFQDLRQPCDRALEIGEDLGRGVGEAELDEHEQSGSQCARLDHRGIALDGTGPLQPAHTLQAGRRGEPDLGCEVGVGDPTVGL